MTPQPPARDATRALECTVCGDFMSEFCSKCGADFAVNKEVATWESFFQYSTLADDESLRVSLGFLRALVLRYRKLETAPPAPLPVLPVYGYVSVSDGMTRIVSIRDGMSAADALSNAQREAEKFGGVVRTLYDGGPLTPAAEGR